ncbi:MAG: DUF5085 family protein [Butyrivibrio sp.]|nr:DUF5085 family protein [Butyrivibrio sp.]
MDEKQLETVDYENVLYKSYAFPYRQFKAVVQEFSDGIRKRGLKAKGMFFYTLDGIDQKDEGDSEVRVTLYQPLAQPVSHVDDGYMFEDRHYYGGLTYRVVEDDYDRNAQKAYFEIMDEAKEKGKRVTSAFYNEFLETKDEKGNKKVICVIKAQIE